MSPKNRPIWLIGVAAMLGSLALCIPAAPPREFPSHTERKSNAQLEVLESSNSALPKAPPPAIHAHWTDRPPVLPARLANATPLSSEEVAWDNGAVQRRTVYRQVNGAHTLLLETSIQSSPLVTRYLYTADRLLVIERTEDLGSIISRLRLQGLMVSQPSPDSAHAHIHLQRPELIFASLESLKQLVGATASIQLNQMELK
jgi:hypothetical protein